MIARLMLFGIVFTGAATLGAQNAPAVMPAAVNSTSPRQLRQRAVRSAAHIADSIAVAGDSNAALAYLDSVVKKSPKDFAALNERGKLAWNMGRATRRDVVQPPRAIKLLTVADSSLRMATVFAPDSARYWIDLTRFALNSGNAFVRARAEPYMEKAVKAAEKAKDSVLVSDASDELGMMWWRRYEASANKGIVDGIGDLIDRGVNSSTNDPGKTRPWKLRNSTDHINQMVKLVTPPTGAGDYGFALANLHRARFANTLNTRARGHYYMALVERRQWSELRSDASAVVKATPWDFDAQLAVGLAETRLQRAVQAAAAFDSAFAHMTNEAHETFTRVSRILPPEIADSSGAVRVDAGRYQSANTRENAATTEMYWTLADPLYKTNVNENRVEFFARVAYADLRWSSEDFNLRGADSDRGDIFVRYGPPDHEALVSYQPPSTQIDSTTMGPQLPEQKMLIWLYDSGKVFYFLVPPTYGVARIPNDDRLVVADLIDREPVRWDNVAATSSLDTMTVRLARFRAGRDSLDVVTAVSIPAARMLKGTEIGGLLPFDISMREFDNQVRLTYADSLHTRLNSDSVPELINRSWVRRIGPAANVMRIDAFQSDTRRAARGLAMVDDQRPAGYGMSDILLGLSVPNSPANPKHWRDVGMTPAVGYFHLSDPVGMVWEQYNLQSKDGQTHYSVNFDIKYVRDPGMKELLKAYTVKVLARFSDAITNTARGDESVAFTFDRTQAASDVLTDYFSLAFSNLEKGNYRVVVTITDLISKKETQQTTMIRFIP